MNLIVKLPRALKRELMTKITANDPRRNGPLLRMRWVRVSDDPRPGPELVLRYTKQRLENTTDEVWILEPDTPADFQLAEKWNAALTFSFDAPKKEGYQLPIGRVSE